MPALTGSIRDHADLFRRYQHQLDALSSRGSCGACAALDALNKKFNDLVTQREKEIRLGIAPKQP